ncbi:hypothetical protein L9F63_026799, partial [Diploptera punctata]
DPIHAFVRITVYFLCLFPSFLVCARAANKTDCCCEIFKMRFMPSYPLPTVLFVYFLPSLSVHVLRDPIHAFCWRDLQLIVHLLNFLGIPFLPSIFKSISYMGQAIIHAISSTIVFFFNDPIHAF